MRRLEYRTPIFAYSSHTDKMPRVHPLKSVAIRFPATLSLKSPSIRSDRNICITDASVSAQPLYRGRNEFVLMAYQ